MTRLFVLCSLLLALPAPAQDWADLARYREQNAALIASGQKPDVVFMGDSITEGWIAKRPDFFTAARVDRGINGQTTPQMLARFREDVIALHPRMVHIMAGTNDIAGNTGPMTAEMTEANLASMAELAQASGIGVILASIPPAAGFPWRPGLETAGRIAALNEWIRDYAAGHGLVYADYWSAMQDGHGGMKPGLAYDGVHPTEQGYDAMLPVVEAAMKAAIR